MKIVARSVPLCAGSASVVSQRITQQRSIRPQFGATSLVSSDSDEVPSLLLQAVEQQDLVALKALLAQGADVDEEQESDGTTPLLAAAEQGQIKAAAILLQANASINKGDSYGRTPLILAAWEGHFGMAQLLLSAGALPHVKDAYEKTALTYAVEAGHHHLAELLFSVADSSALVATSLVPDELLALARESAEQNHYGLLKRLLRLPALESLFGLQNQAEQPGNLPNPQADPNHSIWQCLRGNGFQAFRNRPFGLKF